MQDSDGISSQNFPKLQDQMTSLVNYTKHQFFSSSSKNGRRENSNLFYEANITLILNPDKDIIWKKNWPIFLMNIGAKRLKNYYQTESSSVQSLSRVWPFVIPWTAPRQASLSNTKSCSLLKLMSIESVMPSKHLILCHPLLLPPLLFPSIRVFSDESVFHIRWPKYWSFNFNISLSNEYSGLSSFGIDCLDALAVQGTLKSLLQHHSSKRHQLFSAQLSL